MLLSQICKVVFFLYCSFVQNCIRTLHFLEIFIKLNNCRMVVNN